METTNGESAVIMRGTIEPALRILKRIYLQILINYLKLEQGECDENYTKKETYDIIFASSLRVDPHKYGFGLGG
jgi:hypothetical protein